MGTDRGKRLQACFVLGMAVMLAVSAAAADTREELRAWHRAFDAACLAGDRKAIATLFTEDAVIIPPQRPLVQGPKAIGDAVMYAFDYGLSSLSSQADDVFADDETAVEVGRTSSRFRDGTVSRSRFMILFQKVEGRWLAHRALTNADH
jgi:ketosteroid isomerase-like protein